METPEYLTRLRSMRETLGTQVAVGKQLGVAAESISRWERGVVVVPRWYVHALTGLAQAVASVA